MRPFIRLDDASSLPVHRQIYEGWRDAILSGRLGRGERLPSSRDLAAALGVARSTVTVAYEQLAAEGYLDARRGSGTFVCRELPEELLRARPAPAQPVPAQSALPLTAFGDRLERDFHYPPRPRGHICFSHSAPDIEAFPFSLWRKLLNRHLRKPRHALADYAERSGGYEPLRREIAAYTARSRAVHCEADQVVVVNGSQQALDFCARLFVNAGDRVAFEDPGYLGTRRILEAHGARLQPVPVDAEGMVVADIEARARLCYVTPSHQFPTGVALSLPRRLELIEWARRRTGVIIEDDYDSEYRYSGAPLPSLQGLGGDGHVIYCGTFSKVMFPSLRIGYAIVPKALAAVFARLKWLSDRHTSLLEQAALADFLHEGHLDRHIRRMRRRYAARRAALVQALAHHFGDRVTLFGDPAGMHLLVRFADEGIEAAAAKSRVQLVNAGVYYLRRPPRNTFLLGFAGLDEQQIGEGVRRLAAAL